MTSFSDLIQFCITYCWINLIRPMVKGFLRRTTGLCELQRICYATHGPGADRCCQVHSSILLSRSTVIQKVRDRLILSGKKRPTSWLQTPVERTETTSTEEAQLIEFAVEAICQEKRIKTEIHQEFVVSLRISLTQLFYYKIITEEAIRLAATPYDKDNQEHQSLLLQLWNSLKDSTETSVQKPDWTEVGFQGKDPSTDFRAMGLLGLQQLLFLATHYNETCKSILSTSNHPTKGYPFAITGIHLTHLTLTLMTEENLRTHFFNSSTDRQPHYWLQDLHKAYVCIFAAFNKFWIQENPVDVMQFRFVREKFVLRLVSHLSHTEATLHDWSCPLVESI